MLSSTGCLLFSQGKQSLLDNLNKATTIKNNYQYSSYLNDGKTDN